VKNPPLVVDVDDAPFDGGRAPRLGRVRGVHRGGDAASRGPRRPDEWDAIALNYTSGTTGNPKGVVYHYRGAYLNALNNILDWSMPRHPVYLWTLPMFHCNGWCFNWTLAAAAGTNVCLRKVDPKLVLELIRAHRGHALLRRADRARDAAERARRMEARDRPRGALPRRGRSAPAAVIEGMGRMGFDITHVYGPHRDIRAGRRLREARGVGGAALESRCAATGARASPTSWRRA
jgi:fatty-acyl-CoA synthase